MSNAAKFSDKGSSITIELERMKTSVRIAVKDTGAGIPEAAQATIFNRFTQADSSDQRKKGGTGLGLNIVKSMVAAHGGTIAFDSVEGKGTTFYFDLKIVADETNKILDRTDSPPQLLTSGLVKDMHTCERGSAACIATVKKSDGMRPKKEIHDLKMTG